jgi:hypothetical protein
VAAGFRNGDRPGDALVTACRCLLTAAVGREGGRLRVHRLRLGPVSYAAAERATIMVE